MSSIDDDRQHAPVQSRATDAGPASATRTGSTTGRSLLRIGGGVATATALAALSSAPMLSALVIAGLFLAGAVLYTRPNAPAASTGQ